MRLLGSAARRGLHDQLARTLLLAGSQVLAQEFALFRHLERSPWQRSDHPDGISGSALYDRFVQSVHGDGYAQLTRHYPVLGRIWAGVVRDWHQAVRELVERVAADSGEVAARLGVADCGPVVDLRSARSDRHHGGRVVWICRFAAGTCVYKPRDLASESCWQQLLVWYNGLRPPVDLRPLWVWCRDGYGWEELAASGPCIDDRAVGRYYRRAGALLCLTHVVAGSDCHRENLFTAGEYPVLVDLETLLTASRPAQPGTGPRSATEAARERLARSVLGTGLLPHWSPAGGGRGGIDGAGLDSGGQTAVWVDAEGWRRDRLDGVVLREEQRPLAPTQNIVTTSGGGDAPATRHVADILDGYNSTHRFLAHHRKELLACLADLHGSGVAVRVIRRPTSTYARLLWRSLAPDALRSERDRDQVLDLLRSPESPQQLPPATVEAEQAALRRLDIPHFSISSAAADGVTGAASGWREVQGRVSAMDGEQAAQQTELIRMAFLARAHAVDRHARPGSPPAGPAVGDRAARSSRGAFEAAAAAIADRVCSAGVPGRDGSTSWVVPDVGTQAGTFGVCAMGPALYSGLAGVVLFLSAAAAILGHADARRAARGALLSLSGLDPRRERLGGVMGAGSVCWALAWSATLLDEEPFLTEAVRWAPAPDDERFVALDTPDLAGGSAGMLLALLRLHAVTGLDRHLDSARRCAGQVLSLQTGSGGWTSRDGTCLTGLAHGAAGISHALFRLHELITEERLLSAAVGACAFERTLYVPERRNWRDLRPDVPPGAFMTAWCNGAAGIALARSGWTTAGSQIAGDYRRAVRTTADYQERGVDHLCCGALGRAGVLLTCGLRHRDQALIEAGHRRAVEVAERAGSSGGYRVAGDPVLDVQHASFFRGISGIGYQLLRFAAPDRLPDALLLE